VSNFLVEIKERPPKSIRVYIAVVKVFLLENGIELPQLFWRRLGFRVKGSRARTIDKIPSNAELRATLQHMPIHGKAFFSVLLSSGMRIGEISQVLLSDIDLSHDPCRINIRGKYTKTGNSRIAFISSEAKELITEWLKVRNKYLYAAVLKSSFYEKNPDDQRLFPFEGYTASQVWHHALSKTGLLEKDPSTNRITLHPHCLRKFFRTRMGSIIPVDVAEALMGHEGYLTEVYRRYSQEDLAEFYKKGESSILVFSNGAEVSKLRVEVEEKNKQLQTVINSLATENSELKSRIRKAESTLGEVVKTLSRLEVVA
jgi:integrase